MLLLALIDSASAVVYEVEFCFVVDISYDDLSGGDRWTSGDDQPATGFKYTKANSGGAFLSDGFLAGLSGNEGCVTLNLTGGVPYDIKIESRAMVDNGAYGAQEIQARDHLSGSTTTITVVNDYVATAETTEYPAPLPGSTEDRWNHLVLLSNALSWEPGRVPRHDVWGDPIPLVVYSYDDCIDPHPDGTCAAPQNMRIYANETSRRFLLAHLLGHLVSWEVNEDAPAASWNYSTTATDDGCVGNDPMLSKEYSSFAAMEGLADFYAALTWNDLSTAGCTYHPWYNLDWNLDGTIDTAPTGTFTCEGDPYTPGSGPDPLDAEDWLEDLVAFDDDDLDAVQCTGTLTNRSTPYDWLRYSWEVVSADGQAVPIGSFWEVLDEVEPNQWRDDDVGAQVLPDPEWESVMDIMGYGAEHDAAKPNGLDH